MALRVPEPDEGGGAVWPHDWHSYDDYLTVHNSHMRALENEGLVEEGGLSFREVREAGRLRQVRIGGRLRCRGGIVIQVDKTLAVRQGGDGPQVRGEDYSYHAWLEDTGQQVLRYDMAHYWEGLHCHVFDLHTGVSEIHSITLDQLPTLDGFIRIVCKRVSDARAEG